MSREYQNEGIYVNETSEIEYQVEGIYVNETVSVSGAQAGFFSFMAFWMGGAGNVGAASSFVPRLPLLGVG